MEQIGHFILIEYKVVNKSTIPRLPLIQSIAYISDVPVALSSNVSWKEAKMLEMLFFVMLIIPKKRIWINSSSL